MHRKVCYKVEEINGKLHISYMNNTEQEEHEPTYNDLCIRLLALRP